MKHPKGVAEHRRKEVLDAFKGLGKHSYDSIEAGAFPEISLPSRSVNNIVYDEVLKQYILGSNTVKRSSHNVKHIRPFTQLLWLAYFASQLVGEQKTSTLRDAFYSAQAYSVEFADQSESDEIITDLETALMKAREDFNIFPEERSAIFGNITIEYTVPGYEGRRLDLSSHPDGVMIGPALTTAELVDTDAEMVIAIEKGGLFTRFVEEKVHERFKAILINTAGQPPRSTRYLIRRMNQELRLPVNIFTDSDPWGAHIAMVIKSGSVRRDEPIVVRDAGGRTDVLAIGDFVDDRMAGHGFVNDPFGNEVCDAAPFEVLTVDESNKVRFAPMTAAIRHRHVGFLYSLTTRSGRAVCVTPNHSVFVLRDGRLAPVQTSEMRVGDLLAVERNASVGAAASTVLRQGTSVLQQVVRPAPGAFPVLAGGLVALKQEIGGHRGHDGGCDRAYLRICEVLRAGEEGGIGRSGLADALEHVGACGMRGPDARTRVEPLLRLVEGDVGFDPVVKIERTPEVDEYVYDVSVPGVERFIGGRTGILLHNSANAAHLRELTTPDAKWLGVWPSDINAYDLPHDKLDELDVKRVYELLKDPRYDEKLWRRELNTFLKYKKKAEQEAFAKYGLTYIVDKYLVDKLEEAKSM